VEEFSAGDYLRAARAALAEARSRAALPLVVGGTGLYLRALLSGLFDGPGRSDALRDRLHAIAGRGGLGRLHRALARVDPAAAARIPPADRPRIVRAYEVWLATGRPLTAWQDRGRAPLAGFRWLKLAVAWPRPELYARIDARVDAMFAAGLVEEVRELAARHGWEAPAFKAIGYREVADYLRGRRPLAAVVEATKQASRRYAKRQSTWFRTEPDLHWIDGTRGEDGVYAEARVRIEAFLQDG
jgi:tRNA dimethylallyltransferase